MRQYAWPPERLSNMSLTFGHALIFNNLLIVLTYIHSRSEDTPATAGKFGGGVPSARDTPC